MRREQKLVNALAEATKSLFDQGINDPSAEEIAMEYFPGKILGGEVIEGIRKRLHKIREVLETSYEESVCLLGATYYARFRGKPIETLEDARKCLPLGNMKRAEGIYRQQGVDDLIWRAALELGASQGAAKVKRALNRTIKSVEMDALSPETAASIIQGAKRKAIPEKPELERRILEATPERKALEEGSHE